MASHRKTDLVVDAVTMAVHHRGGHVPGVIHHRDRGGECSSYRLERELRRPGAPGQHGIGRRLLRQRDGGESLFATIECELFDQQPHGLFETRREAKLAVFDYLRPSTTCAGGTPPSAQVSPARYEQAHTARQAAA